MKTKRLFSLFLILLTGAWLRLYKLASHDLWYDESLSWGLATFIKNVLKMQHYGTQPPLYYLFLHFWTKVFPDNEFWLRLPSVLFGVATIFVLYKLCNLFFSRRIAVLASIIIAISPIHIWYAQEVKPYSLIPFFVIVMSYFFIKALEENRAQYWTGLLITTFIGFFTSYFIGIFVIGELAVLCLKRYRKYFAKWLRVHIIFGLIICAIFFPWVSTFFLQCISLVKEGFWIQRPSLNSLFITFNNFNVGYTVSRIVYIPSFIVFFILFSCGLWHGYKRFKERSIILFLLLTTPILFTFLFSFLIPIYIDRQLIAFSPLYYIFIVLGIEGFRPRPLKPVTFFCIFLFIGSSLNNYYRDMLPLPILYHQGAYIKKPFKPILQYVIENPNLRECVIAFTNPGIELPLRYYYHWYKKLPSFSLATKYYYISGEQEKYWENIFKRKYYSKKAVNLETVDIGRLKGKKILIISGSWSRDGTMDENSRAVNDWMEKRFKKTSEKEFDGIFVLLYEKR